MRFESRRGQNEKNKIVATPLWASVRMRLTFPKVGTWSPLGLPQLQSSTELNSRRQNTSP